MTQDDISLLKKNISKLLVKNNQKVLIVFDFDGTLVDSFNSVLLPVLKKLNIELGSYEEFSNRQGSYKKYLGNNGHRVHNLKKYYKLDKHVFQKTLMEEYLNSSRKIKETFYLIQEIQEISNIEFGVVSRNYISNYFNPEHIISTVLKKLHFFKQDISFVKRITPRKKKTKCFQLIRKDHPNHIILSLGDEIGDYISGISAKFDGVFAINGYDSKELFEKHKISISIKEKLLYTFLYSIERRLYQIYAVEEKSHLFDELI